MPGAWLPAVVIAAVDCVTDTSPAVPPLPPPPPIDTVGAIPEDTDPAME